MLPHSHLQLGNHREAKAHVTLGNKGLSRGHTPVCEGSQHLTHNPGTAFLTQQQVSNHYEQTITRHRASQQSRPLREPRALCVSAYLALATTLSNLDYHSQLAGWRN